MDPMPYVTAAYTLGGIFIIGTAFYLILERRKLQLMRVMIKKEAKAAKKH